MKNSLEGLNSIFEHVEERISNSKDRSIEIIQSEEQEENRTKKKEQIIWDLWASIKCSSMYVFRTSEWEERKGQKEYVKKVDWKLPIFGKKKKRRKLITCKYNKLKESHTC